MIVIRSALGRAVPLADRSAQDEDRILKVLHDFRARSAEQASPFLGMRELSMFSRMSPDELQAPLNALTERRLIERNGDLAPDIGYRISSQGEAFVWTLQHAA